MNIYKVTIDKDGVQVWRDPETDNLHRLDGPAYINGECETYYLDGKRHRLDGPAYTNTYMESYWVDGKRHRLDGPAIIHRDYTAYYANGKLHRLDGPAVIDGDSEEYWVDGIEYTKEEFQWVEEVQNASKSLDEFHEISIGDKKYIVKEVT